MKLTDYEMLEAMRARDWRAAAQCLARHFDIVDLLPSLDSFKVRESDRLDVAMTLEVYYRRNAWYWDEVSGFATGYLRDHSRAKVFAEYCNED